MVMGHNQKPLYKIDLAKQLVSCPNIDGSRWNELDQYASADKIRRIIPPERQAAIKREQELQRLSKTYAIPRGELNNAARLAAVREFDKNAGPMLVKQLSKYGLTVADICSYRGELTVWQDGKWARLAVLAQGRIAVTGQGTIQGEGNAYVAPDGSTLTMHNEGMLFGKSKSFIDPSHIKVWIGRDAKVHFQGPKELVKIINSKINFSVEGKGTLRIRGGRDIFGKNIDKRIYLAMARHW
jgi:hypothetical protein